MQTSPSFLTWLAALALAAAPAAEAQVTANKLRTGTKSPDLAAFAVIPGGEFTMGDTLDGTKTATPHPVTVSAFSMQKKEVTKAQWDEVRAWSQQHGYPDLALGEGRAADHPVQSLTWFDAVRWCNAKSEKEGLIPCYYTDAAQTAVLRTGNPKLDNTMVKWSANGYRLPTEAEWEKAARGGLSGKRFPWGDTITHNEANYESNVADKYDESPTRGHHPTYAIDDFPFTSPVGSFAANGYGLFDMAGNVWEWCWDWYGTYPTEPSTDPRGAATGTRRVNRGGSWGDYARTCRAAYRYNDFPSSDFDSMGFRLACTAVPVNPNPVPGK
ncbi:MAG: SUMF1/EgtB/PvdO family nonheme iron enzyme [Verrucomicrobia bacterium]|nr:SUMF1/EgtB/PvdO family nonheme iron enzyme [Verrucomicrobiota bacterium]